MSQGRRWCGIVYAALVAAGCGDDRALAGSSSEAENVVTARELLVDSLLPEWNPRSDGPTVIPLRLDAANFPFGSASATGNDVSVERLDGPPVPFRIVYWDKLAAKARLEVRLDPWLQEPGSRLRLRWRLRDSIRSDSSKVWKSIPDSTRTRIASALVDDFERSSLRSPMPDSGWWYSFPSDSSVKVSVPEFVPAAGGRSGTALHVSYTTPNPKAGFIYVGVSLVGPRCFRSLDSISFWARGPGDFTMAFDNILGPNAGKAVFHKTLDSSWTRLVIRPEDLDPPNGIGGNVGWLRVRDSVTNLTFFVGSGKDLWLDDIRVYGINRDDL